MEQNNENVEFHECQNLNNKVYFVTLFKITSTGSSTNTFRALMRISAFILTLI